MAATVGSGDAWRISGEDRAKHDSQFFALKPVNGFITGEQARGFFMQSGLPTPVLGQIWGLADMNNDGKMDKKEFSIAMHLIKKKLQGYELPKSLPPQLKADPSPVMGSFGSMPSQPAMMGMTPGMGMAMGPRMPMMANGMPQMVPNTGYMGAAPMSVQPGGFAGAVPMRGGTPPVAGGNMVIPHQNKLKYTQFFNTHDRNKRGSLTGVEARSILMSTGVPQQMLAQIWNLSDIDKDGKLDCEEFCIAMHLTDIVKMGQVLPAKLPPELIAGKARSGSFGSPTPVAAPAAQPKDSFSDLLGNIGMPPPVQLVTNGDTKVEDPQDMSPVTFEDRRKQNFDKGQAELERRRQQLQEQMRKENEARLEKERKEQEKREKQRQDQEMKRQQELEKQLEKQRAIEREKEEHRRKMMEQREAARRELERQRQMEWERQRKEQLMAEKAREYEQLSALKSQSSNLKGELELLQGKKSEINGKISQVKNGVTDFTAHIEAMRSTRDLKNNDIDRLQRELQELNQKLLAVQSERQNLDLRVQTSIQSNPMSETHRTMMHSVELKKTSVQRLKKDLEQIEKDTEGRLAEIDTLNTQLKESNNSVNTLQKDISSAQKKSQDSAKQDAEEQARLKKEKEKHEKLRKDLEAQRKKEESVSKSTSKEPAKAADTSEGNWFAFGGDSQTSAASTDNWASVFDSQPSSQPSSIDWGASFASQTNKSSIGSDTKTFKLSGSKQKYLALYQFDARNEDELTLNVGDVVWVFDDQTGAEPGWKGGEMNGTCGWFPEAYVEKAPEDSSQASFGATTDTSAGLMSSEDSSFMTVPVKVPAVSPTPGQGKAAPDGLQAQALYPWKAKKDNHLTFNKGDIISVREQQDMWWSGELNSKVGWFPKSYVKLISGPSALTSTATSSGTASPVVSVTPQPAANGTQSPALDTSAGETYIAVYTYQSTEPGDLIFNQGEIITVIKKDGDWWTGTFSGKTGIFPANYVKTHEQPPQQQPPGDVAGSSAVSSQPDLLTDSTVKAPDSGTSSSPFPESSDTNPKVEDLFIEDPFKEISDNKSPFDGVLNDPLKNSNVLSTGESVGLETPSNVTAQSPFQSDPFNADVLSTDQGAGLDAPSKVTVQSPFQSDIFNTNALSTDQVLGLESLSKVSAQSLNSNEPIDSTLLLTDRSSKVETLSKATMQSPPSSDLFAGLGNTSSPSFGTQESKLDSLSSSENLGNTSLGTKLSENDLFSGVGVTDDPFAGKIEPNLNEISDPFGSLAQTSEPSLDKTAGKSDPFAFFGESISSDSGLSSDPFAGSEQVFASESLTTPLDSSCTQSLAPQAEYLPSVPNTMFDSPSSLIQSIEDDATTSLPQTLDLTPGTSSNTASCDSSIQTSSSIMNLSALESPAIESSSASDSKSSPPPIPAKGSLKKSLNKPGLDSFEGTVIPASEPSSEAGEVTPTDLKYKITKQAPGGTTGSLKKPEIATVIAPYQATGEEQLSLSPGQLIQVRKKSPSGWWEGELQARGQKRKIGWFPANYVKLLQASARNTPDNTLGSSGKSSPAQAVSGNRSANPSPAPQAATSSPSSHSYVDHVIALYPYTAHNPDELTFQKDAVINVIKKDDPDWWSGELNGQVGMFPSNYVQSSTPESTSWSNDPQVLALTSKEEGKRQSYIHELINTEETYMADMSIVLDAFYKPMKEGVGLTEPQLQQIFVNWKDLIVCNTKLQKALRVRKKMCGIGQVINSIGDILCENIPHMTPYIRFCSCQLNAAALLQKISENSPTFNEIHKKCVQNPKTKGMPMSSFLLKPMQRITKYPLIVEKILKHTPEGHPDHVHLLEALERCQELCSQVNEGVREKENSDRLEWIQQHVHCDGLPEKITFNSVTNCLGPRKLLHTGVVYKTKSNKELGAFLFNDFLLLTTSNRPLNSSTHSLFDNTGSVQYKMYKSPIFLNEIMVKKPGSDDPESFTVSHIDRVYNLRCHSQNERDTWVKRLDAASRHYLETERRKREKAISLRRTPGVGRLLVVIVEGKDLQACDDNGKSDPYCEVSMGAQEHKTKVINNTLNPKWNSSMQFTIRDVDMDALCITVFDRDLFSPNAR